MIKILVITPYERDANSFWRCMGPMTYLQKHSDGEIQITLSQSNNGIAWCDVMQYDVVFLHRPCRTDDLTVMQIAHNCGIPTWVDYDDWLFNIPSWNRSSQIYNANSVQSIMAQCLVSADMVSVSTPELLEKFSQVNPNVVLLSNAYRSDLFTYRKPELQPRTPVAYWRGSDTHDGDLLSVKEGFKGLDGKLRFMGGVNWLLLSSLEQGSYELVQGRDVIMYYQFIYEMNAKVCVFPLVDCFFNRCKSNIAWMEAMHAGAICVAPLMPEWINPGVVNYTAHDPDSFRDAVNYALGMDPVVHQNQIELGFSEMRRKYDIQVINDLRQESVLNLDKDYSRPTPFDQPAAMEALILFKGVQVAQNI